LSGADSREGGKMKKLVLVLSMAMVLGFTTFANAKLYNRGGGMIYDSDQNITWLQDANYAKTSGYDADGMMTWSDAMAWAGQLTYGGYTDWRLPISEDGPWEWTMEYVMTVGFNNTTSEMGYMYYENLKNIGQYDAAGETQPGWGLTHTSPFGNLQPYDYWSGTSWGPEYANPLLPNEAWTFNFSQGYVDPETKDE
jgi:hypothetical protein